MELLIWLYPQLYALYFFPSSPLRISPFVVSSDHIFSYFTPISETESYWVLSIGQIDYYLFLRFHPCEERVVKKGATILQKHPSPEGGSIASELDRWDVQRRSGMRYTEGLPKIGMDFFEEGRTFSKAGATILPVLKPYSCLLWNSFWREYKSSGGPIFLEVELLWAPFCNQKWGMSNHCYLLQWLFHDRSPH